MLCEVITPLAAPLRHFKVPGPLAAGLVSYPFLSRAPRAVSAIQLLELAQLALAAARQLAEKTSASSWVELSAIDCQQAAFFNGQIRRITSYNVCYTKLLRRGEGIPLVLLGSLLRRPQGFWFEFSDDGEASRQGECFLTGLGSPIFRIAPPQSAASHSAQILPFPGSRRHKP